MNYQKNNNVCKQLSLIVGISSGGLVNGVSGEFFRNLVSDGLLVKNQVIGNLATEMLRKCSKQTFLAGL